VKVDVRNFTKVYVSSHTKMQKPSLASFIGCDHHRSKFRMETCQKPKYCTLYYTVTHLLLVLHLRDESLIYSTWYSRNNRTVPGTQNIPVSVPCYLLLFKFLPILELHRTLRQIKIGMQFLVMQYLYLYK
jgi:hypothetical protein